MKIFFDSQIFGLQDYGGISRYYSELLKRLGSKYIKLITPPFVHNNHYLTKNRLWYKDRILNKFKYKNYFYFLLNYFMQIPTILQNNYDIIHPTYYEIYYPRYICKKKVVITVYDLIHEKLNKEYKKLSNSISVKKAKYLKRADRIIAISKNTKKDIVEIYKVPEEKIDVVYLGNSLDEWDKIIKLQLPKKYILFVGQRWLYKNFNNFIIAASKILKNDSSLKVVCAGGGKFTHKENILLKKLKIEKQVCHISFSLDRDLSEIYARALLFVYPSLYEGFGIPILEAFSTKTALAVSNTSCFPEIAGDAALFFDPSNVDSIKNAISRFLDDENLRKKMINKGTKRLKLFSWEKTAKETIKVYKKAMSVSEKYS
jgi:glycosyltransferase involved in cell wall biosynthesis